MNSANENPGSETPLSHLDAAGRARMVDVSGKSETVRRARARAVVQLTPAVLEAVLAGELPKGEAIAVARIAGIQAAKATAQLIPLCHPLPLSAVSVTLEPAGDDRIVIEADVRCTGPTGVEMEAMAAVSVAALTLYDMCKALHRGIEIREVALLHKSGGRSGEWNRGE